MSSFLDKREGIYNKALRFAFTNITAEEFRSAWDGSPIIVPAGQTIELPEHLAIKLTTELVDKIMIGEAKMDELAHEDKAYYRSPKGSSLGVPSARKPWEDKILRQLADDEESPQIQVLRAEIKSQLLADMNKQPGVADEPETIEKKPIKVKKI